MEQQADSFVAFPIPVEIRELACITIEQVRSDPHSKTNAHQMCGAILAITDYGLDYLYLYPLKLAGVGILSMNTVRFGVSTAKKGISLAVNQIVGAMRGEKLCTMANFLESILHLSATEPEANPKSFNDCR